MRGGTVEIDIFSASITALADLFDESQGIDFTGANGSGIVEINVKETVAGVEIDQANAAAGSEFHIYVADKKAWEGTEDAVFGSGSDVIKTGGGEFSVGVLTARDLTVSAGKITAAGAVNIRNLTIKAGSSMDVTGSFNLAATQDLKIEQAAGGLEVGGTTGARNIVIQGGSNTFTDVVTVGATAGGDLTITGGSNTFVANVRAGATGAQTGNLFFRGGENTFAGASTTLFAYHGGELSFEGGKNTFTGSTAFNVQSGDTVTVDKSTFILNPGATLVSSNQPLEFINNSVLQVGPAGTGGQTAILTANARTVTFDGSTLNLGANKLTVTDDAGVITMNNSTINVRHDGTDYGRLDAGDTTVTFTGQTRLDIYGKVSDVLAAYGGSGGENYLRKR